MRTAADSALGFSVGLLTVSVALNLSGVLDSLTSWKMLFVAALLCFVSWALHHGDRRQMTRTQPRRTDAEYKMLVRRWLGTCPGHFAITNKACSSCPCPGDCIEGAR